LSKLASVKTTTSEAAFLTLALVPAFPLMNETISSAVLPPSYASGASLLPLGNHLRVGYP